MSFILNGMLKMFGLNPDAAGKLSWTEVIVMSLVPAGQLYARIFKFKGSLDKWWLMFPLLLFPPLSFIPMILMKYGYVADGKGSDPVDKIMLLPIIVKFIIPFIMPYLIDADSRILTIIVSFIFKLLFVMIANLYRRYDNCNKTITMDNTLKAGYNSIVATSIADVVPIAMKFVPVVGTLYSVVSMVPIIGNEKIIDSVFWTFAFGATYALLNMFNQLDMDELCKKPFALDITNKTPLFMSLAALVGAHAFNYIVGGDLPDDGDDDD